MSSTTVLPVAIVDGTPNHAKLHRDTNGQVNYLTEHLGGIESPTDAVNAAEAAQAAAEAAQDAADAAAAIAAQAAALATDISGIDSTDDAVDTALRLPDGKAAATLATKYADRALLPLTEARLLGVQRAALAQTATGATLSAWSASGTTDDGVHPAVGYVTTMPDGAEVSAVLDPFGARTLNPLFTYAGAAVIPRPGGYPANLATQGTGLSFDAAELMPRKFFVIDGAAKFELVQISRGQAQTRFRFRIDGAWVNPQPIDGAVNDGQPRTLIVTLPDTGRHEVMIESSGYVDWFMGIRVPAGAKVTKHLRPLGPRWIIPGDSQVEGFNGVVDRIGNPFGYAAELARLNGIVDYWQSGIGSTGYVATAGGTRPNIKDRIHTDVSTRSPDVVILPMSQNDTSATKDQIRTNVLFCIDDILAANPACLIVVVANMQPQTGAGLAAIRDAGKEAAAARGLLFIDTTAWLTADNRSTYVSSDDSHLSDTGHQAYARHIAAAFQTALSPAGLPTS